MSGYRVSHQKERSRFGSRDRDRQGWGYWASTNSKDLELNNTIDIMMDCPHHVNCVKKVPTNVKLACAVCKASGSPWLCLSCGLIHCGRYVNGHAKQHYADNKLHSIAIDCNSYEAYCYTCDEYVSNEFVPQLIIDKLSALHNASSGIKYGGYGDELDGGGAGGGESVMSSRLPSMGDMEESNSSNFSSSSTSSSANNDDRFKQPINTCDQNHSSNARKRNVLDFGGVSGVVEIKNSKTKGSSTAAGKNAAAVNGKARNRSNNGRFQSAKGANSNRLSSNNGQLQRNLRKKSGDSNSGSGSAFVDDLSHASVDDGVSDSKKRRLNSDDSSGTSKSDNNNNSKSMKNNSRRTKENESIECKDKHGIVGLRNLGNTCFMNSVLQSLSKINEFSQYMAHIPAPDQLKSTLTAAFNGTRTKPFAYSTRSKKNLLLTSQNSIISNNLDRVDMSEEFLTNELRKILILLNTKGSAAVSPDGLFTIIWEVMPRFRGYQQQDAHEFLRYMLDRLHIELIHVFPTWGLMGSKSKTDDLVKNGNGINHDNTRHRNSSGTDNFLTSRAHKGTGSIVTSMFGGILQNEVRCSVCGIDSKKNDPFLDLSLDIPLSANGEAKLEDCLTRFVDVEELNDADKYFCSHCKTHQKSTKRFWIRSLPNVLCLHLKRFRWANYLRTKLDHYVQFPLTELDMSEYLLRNNHTRASSESFLYDLAAVIVHHGSGVGTGHYTAFAKNDGQWYHFNDSTVKPSEESMVAKCKAYILFYTRKELKS